MATPDNMPKVINDIQDAVVQLCEQFKITNEPITDDNQDLHRLCAKLEFLFSSSVKEQSILSVSRSYWNWIYACLKGTKGLSDGVRYVRGYKEVRSAAGKGRLFVRYCLVHHTLADSLQNCIMNKTATNQYINPKSILASPLHSSAFVTALYDLHDVNFDLNTKGYDLDSGWPTFASKILSQPTDKWEIQSNAESTSSGSTTLPMESPQTHGSVNTAPHVDHRVEELVFELDQADNRTKAQQDVIVSHEAKTEDLMKFTNEEDNALTQTISDLESKNRLLHDTIDQLSADFQTREQEWIEKHDVLVEKLRSSDEKNETLSSKIQELERNIKDSIDQSKSEGSVVTLPTSHTLAPASSSHSDSSAHEMSNSLDELNAKNLALAEQLADSQAQSALLESKMKENLLHTETLSKWEDKIEKQQTKIEELKTEVCDMKLQHETFLCRVKEALQLDDKEACEINEIIESIRNLRESAKEMLKENAAKCKDAVSSVALQEESHQMAIQPGPSTCRVKEMEDEVVQLKVELEVMSTKAAVRIGELEDQISTTNQDKDSQQHSYRELLADLQKTRENLKETEAELEAARGRCAELYQKESDLKEELESTKRHYEDEICENEFILEELQAEMKHQVSVNDTLDQKLGQEKVKCHRLNGELLDADRLVKTFTRELEETKETLTLTEDTVSKFQADMERINETELVREKQMNFFSGQVEGFFEHIRLLEESEDLEKVTLQGTEVSAVDDADGVGKWDTLQSKFFDILLKYKETKSELASLEKRYISSSTEAETCRKQTQEELEQLREELSEVQSHNDIHLVTIKDLSDKHKVLQDAKASISDEIEKIQFEKNELTQSLKESQKAADELRLRIMEESAKRLELEGKVELQDSDIESLKDKVTQLLLDKDTLWKEKEELRDRFNEHPEDPGEPDWMHDDEVTNCTGCDTAFSITLRRHHCRICGKIFCKNCCGNWKERKSKKIRVCNSCLETTLLSQSNLTADDTSQISSTPTETPSKEYEEIAGEEIDAAEQVDDDIFSDFDDKTPNVKSQDNILVPARREVHLPVQIERDGIVLHWEISTDRDINFKLCYSSTEDEALQELVPVRRIDSHIKPFTGDIEAKKKGVYTLILDNTYSRFTAKQVLYTLRTFT